MSMRQDSITVIQKSNTKSDDKHKKSTNSIYEHLRYNQWHKINWEKITFLDKERNWKKTKIKEAVYIHALNPTVKMNSSRKGF